MRKPKRSRFNTDVSVSAQQAYNKLLHTAISSTTIPSKDFLLGALRARQYGALLDWSDRPSPQLYDSEANYFADCQIAALIRKYPFTPDEVPGIDPEATAIAKFAKSEHQCKRQNQRWAKKRKRFNPHAQCMQDARSYILKVLGPRPNLEAIYSKCDFTSGASIGVSGSKTGLARKLYAQEWTTTPTALYHSLHAMWMNIHIRDCILPGAIKCYDQREFAAIVKAKVKFVSYNNVTFVPKTAKTHRAIAVEPLLNGYIQKGIDQYMRARLKRIAGIDLSDQEHNQALAREGSDTSFNPYVTIDLAAASDSLSVEVVKDLVPPEWFDFLMEIRAPRYRVNGSAPRSYEKFCSMGNGFCFPLQSLVFASICHAAAHGANSDSSDFSVYGDDLVVRQNTALLVIELLRDIGFRTNVDKTFITGPFRESCGADWFKGQDVRPVHLADRLVDIRQLFAFHNSTLRSRRAELFFEEVRPVIRSLGGESFLRPGREPGDTAFSVPLDVAMNSTRVSWRRRDSRWVWHEIESQSVPDPGRLDEISHANVMLMAVLRGANSSMPFALRYTSRAIRRAVSRPWKDVYNRGDLPRKRMSVCISKVPYYPQGYEDCELTASS